MAGPSTRRRIPRALLVLPLLAAAAAPPCSAHVPSDSAARGLIGSGLRTYGAHRLLARLCAAAPHRLAGSAGERRAIALAAQMLRESGADSVWSEPLMVPHWERGPVERGELLRPGSRRPVPLAVCALGGGVPTPRGGLTADVVEVRSFEELARLGDSVRGKIVLLNRPMDPAVVNTFDAYGGAVDQRARGASEAAKCGAAGVLVRSVTLAEDDVPHTGAVNYLDGVPRIPAAAVSTRGANLLSSLLARGERVRVRLTLTCSTLPDAPSANVVGQITGKERPNEIVVVGGHLDCWDKGEGAHDDACGCVQAIEVLRILTEAKISPRRTIRAVMFANEENGSRGGKAYAAHPRRAAERHVAAIESDRGGFAPVGLTLQGDSLLVERVRRWRPLFDLLGAGRLERGGSGVDVAPTVERGAAGFGLLVEHHRYFDHHHSDNDTVGSVHPRELQVGAVVEALLCYLVSEEGLE